MLQGKWALALKKIRYLNKLHIKYEKANPHTLSFHPSSFILEPEKHHHRWPMYRCHGNAG